MFEEITILILDFGSWGVGIWVQFLTLLIVNLVQDAKCNKFDEGDSPWCSGVLDPCAQGVEISGNWGFNPGG